MDATERLVLAQYARLGAKGKPQRGEWTVLAGIVLSRPDAYASVVALGTGTKCLTSTAVAADGAGGCVHDGHAEVCARRALLLYAMDQLALLATPSADASIFVRDERDGARGRFRMRAGLEFHMWVSQTPCGDASIYTLDDDGGEDAESSPDAPPHKRQRADAPEDAGAPAGAEGAAHHRTGARPAARAAMEAEAACGGSACAVGLARTKPGRGERTCCMSCSDKLARRRRTPNHTSHSHAATSESGHHGRSCGGRWHALGMQGALLSHLLAEPLRLTSLTVAPPCSVAALSRAIVTRVQRLDAKPLRLGVGTGAKFADGPPESADADARPCTNSIVWAATGEPAEAINGCAGVRLGANRKKPSPKHRSATCKALMLARFDRVCAALEAAEMMPRPPSPATDGLADGDGDEDGGNSIGDGGGDGDGGGGVRHAGWWRPLSYREIKRRATDYQREKAALLGSPPLNAWVVAPEACEEFCHPCAVEGSQSDSEAAAAARARGECQVTLGGLGADPRLPESLQRTG